MVGGGLTLFVDSDDSGAVSGDLSRGPRSGFRIRQRHAILLGSLWVICVFSFQTEAYGSEKAATGTVQ